MKLAVIIVTYNRRTQIEVTLNRLLSEPVDLIVVADNGSTDGTREYLAQYNDSRLETHLLEDNIGGAGGFEFLLRHVSKTHDPDWVLIMDDDARPYEGAISKFRHTDLSTWDAVAAAVFLPDGSICSMNRPFLNPFKHVRVFWRTFLGGGRSAFHMSDESFQSQMAIPIDGGSFVGLFISRQGITRAGFPDGRLFVYGEDGLYTLGLTQAGGRMAFMPHIHFEHDCTTFEGKSEKFTPPWKAYYYHRNLFFLYRKAAGLFFWPALLIVLPKWLWKTKAQGENKRAYLRFLGKAVRDGLLKRYNRAHPD